MDVCGSNEAPYFSSSYNNYYKLIEMIE